MFFSKVLGELYELIGWKAVVDPCCNVIGSNALAPLYFDAMTDALLQPEYLAGKRIVCNPMFDKASWFIDVLLDAFARDQNTRALLIVPERPS